MADPSMADPHRVRRERSARGMAPPARIPDRRGTGGILGVAGGWPAMAPSGRQKQPFSAFEQPRRRYGEMIQRRPTVNSCVPALSFAVYLTREKSASAVSIRVGVNE